ncbi:MAG TPA: DUF2804 domain-containing protein [Pseudomonas sp.]|uniref:DUF2804 domain-containing protein n=3 Tax=Pseudomonas TaxID=286 RepID=UPI000E7FDC8E|nr:DUF2804 domain-containing protein [Pseudomonas sp.]
MNSFIDPQPSSAIALCDAQGQLNPQAIGWSPRPQVDCTLPGHIGRRKRWNHWCITTPQWMLSLTQADIDYLGYGAAYFLDLETGQAVEHSQLRWFARGCRLPNQPQQSHEFNHPRLHLRFAEHPGRLRLTVAAPDIGGQPLQVALDIQRPAHLDSVNLVAPLSRHGFHATCRQLGLPASGNVQLGRTQYNCSAGQSFAAMDFGRGVWPLRSHWTRAAFAAPGGIAGNFGSGWTDHSGLSENALWFGGELQHLDTPVHIEQAPHNPLAPWRLNTDDDRVALTFTPRQYHQACPRLGPFHADTQQWFGHFDGVLRGPQGERVPVDAALGWLGATHARW